MAKCGIPGRLVIFIASLALFVVIAGIYFGVVSNNSHNEPTASVESGALRGQWLDGATGSAFQFAAFRGIPYAQAPTNDLRFKGPRPPLKWSGTFDATKEGSPCFQAGGIGSEDCLFLNVYTPELPSGKDHPRLPVYVFIHGGQFQYGNAGMAQFGPHFLVEQNIVVVTMNYRTGILAHLCLDTDEVPGNFDLKDQVQALRWVQNNIHNFGGDPSKVTLGGQSSGGVSASWLSLLPATRGLIRSAITQSGTAVSSWGYTESNIEFAGKVYELLEGKTTNNLTEIAKTLMSAEAQDLVNVADTATTILQSSQSLGSDILFYHLPCIERRSQGTEEKLISKDPESYIIQNETNFIPTMLGEAKREWAYFFLISDRYKNETVLENDIKALKTIVPHSIMPGKETQKILKIQDEISMLNIDDYVQQVKDFYFTKDDEKDCNDACKMAKYLDHVYIMTDTSHMMRLMSKYSPEPTFGYVFNLKTEHNTDTSDFPTYLRSAVFHGEDLFYIWKQDNKAYDYEGTSASSVGVRRMVTMISNFIKEGNPTPKQDDLITEIWRPVMNNEAQTYLEITETLTQHEGSMEGKDNELWTKIFSAFRANKSP